MVNDACFASYNPVFCGSRRSGSQSRRSGVRFPASPFNFLGFNLLLLYREKVEKSPFSLFLSDTLAHTLILMRERIATNDIKDTSNNRW